MIRKILTIATLVFTISANAFETKAKQALLIEADTGTILYEKNSNMRMSPSSMSKLLVLYIVFEQLKEGKLKLTDQLLVSEKAWKQIGSRMFVLPNAMISVSDLLRGVIIQSGNDATMVLAEGVAGSEEAFVNRMNAKAQEMGLKHSNFMNVTGLPDKNHYSSALDLAIIGNRIILDFPEHASVFSEREFEFNKIRQPNRNTLLFRDIGVNGLKTGHTDSGGYGIVLSAVKDGKRLVAVINGLANDRDRTAEGYKLMQYGFMNFTNIKIAIKDQVVVKTDVVSGQDNHVSLVTHKDIIFTVPVAQEKLLKARVVYPSHILAPKSTNDAVGVIEIDRGNGENYTVDMYPQQDVKELGWFGAVFDKVKNMVTNFRVSIPEVTMKTEILR